MRQAQCRWRPPVLPIPAPKYVTTFQSLYERRWGVALSGEEALAALTALMQFVYLREKHFGTSRREEKHDAAAEADDASRQ